MDGNGGLEWLRGRGIGRERLAGHVAEFLEANGFKVDRSETTAPPETVVRGVLVRMNPAVPDGAKALAFRFVPTGGGCAAFWVAPTAVPDAERARTDRFVRELLQHVERSVSTGSHGTAKVARPPGLKLPWEAA